MKKSISIFFITILLNTSLVAQMSKRISVLPEKKPISIAVVFDVGMMMHFELNRASEIDSIGSVDSWVKKAWTNIELTWDKQSNPYSNYKIDYAASENNPWMYIYERPPGGKFIKIKDDSLLRNKSGVDTLRLVFFGNDGSGFPYRNFNYFVTLTMPDIRSLASLKPGVLDSALQQVRAGLATMISSRETGLINVSLNVRQLDAWNPGKQFRKRNFSVDLGLGVGIQYVRGNWIPSVAIGPRFIKGDPDKKRTEFELAWEPHFLFRTNDSGSAATYRNDFITFRFHNYLREDNDYIPNGFSLGYLAGRRGTIYEPHTMKFSLVIFEYKQLVVEPEFFFNDFFRHFSPSLKLYFRFG